MNDKNCLFCKIIQGTIPSSKVYENEFVFAFRDIAPKAPTHVLVCPKVHHAGVHELSDLSIMQKIFEGVNAIIAQENLAADGYRLVVNYGARGGQAVPHIHVHVFGGRDMSWPPG